MSSLKRLSPEKKGFVKSNPAPRPKVQEPSLAEDEYITLGECNNFDDAVSLIHSHIQMLEV